MFSHALASSWAHDVPESTHVYIAFLIVLLFFPVSGCTMMPSLYFYFDAISLSLMQCHSRTQFQLPWWLTPQCQLRVYPDHVSNGTLLLLDPTILIFPFYLPLSHQNPCPLTQPLKLLLLCTLLYSLAVWISTTTRIGLALEFISHQQSSCTTSSWSSMSYSYCSASRLWIKCGCCP